MYFERSWTAHQTLYRYKNCRVAQLGFTKGFGAGGVSVFYVLFRG